MRGREPGRLQRRHQVLRQELAPRRQPETPSSATRAAVCGSFWIEMSSIGTPNGRVVLDEPDEILRQRRVELRQHLACRAEVPVQPVGLHPRRRRPRVRVGDDLRVLRQHRLQRRDDVRLIVGDREAGQRRIRLSRRQVVVGVRHAGRGEVRRAHRDPDEVQVDPRLTEQRLHRDRVRLGRELVLQQVGGAVGHRGAESGDRLVPDLPVDGDHLAAGRRRREPFTGPLAGQRVRQVGGRLGDGRGRRDRRWWRASRAWIAPARP